MDMESIAPTTLAYVAGLFDGEGSIVIGCGHQKQRRVTPHYWLQVGITNTDRELITWLHHTLGRHISDNMHCPTKRHQRPCWAWRIMSTQALPFLRALMPYLRVKQAQASIAVNFQSHMSARRYKTVPDSVVEERASFRQQLRVLTLGPLGK